MRLQAGLVISLSCVVLALAIRLGAEGQQPPPAGAPPQGQPPAGAPGAPGGGQRPGGAPAPTNLKVLPKEWTRMQVQAVMQTFVTSLGQQPPPAGSPPAAAGAGEGCLHCHVATPPPAGGGRGGTDYAADTNPNKDIARAMIKMVMDINTTTKDVGDKAVVEKISCWSCHQGKSKPAMLPESGWGRGSFSLLPAGPPPAGGPGRGAH